MANYSINNIRIFTSEANALSFIAKYPILQLGGSQDEHYLTYTTYQDKPIIQMQGSTRRYPPQQDCISLSNNIPDSIVILSCIDEGYCYNFWEAYKNGQVITSGEADEEFQNKHSNTDQNLFEITYKEHQTQFNHLIQHLQTKNLSDSEKQFFNSLIQDNPITTQTIYNQLSTQQSPITSTSIPQWANFLNSVNCAKAFDPNLEYLQNAPLESNSFSFGDTPKAAILLHYLENLNNLHPDQEHKIKQLISNQFNSQNIKHIYQILASSPQAAFNYTSDYTNMQKELNTYLTTWGNYYYDPESLFNLNPDPIFWSTALEQVYRDNLDKNNNPDTLNINDRKHLLTISTLIDYISKPRIENLLTYHNPNDELKSLLESQLLNISTQKSTKKNKIGL